MYKLLCIKATNVVIYIPEVYHIAAGRLFVYFVHHFNNHTHIIYHLFVLIIDRQH